MESTWFSDTKIITLLARLIVGRILGVHVIGARDSGPHSSSSPLINMHNISTARSIVLKYAAPTQFAGSQR